MSTENQNQANETKYTECGLKLFSQNSYELSWHKLQADYFSIKLIRKKSLTLSTSIQLNK